MDETSHADRVVNAPLPEDAETRDIDEKIINCFAALEGIFEVYADREEMSRAEDYDHLAKRVSEVRESLTYKDTDFDYDEIRELTAEIRDRLNMSEEKVPHGALVPEKLGIPDSVFADVDDVDAEETEE